MPLFLHPLMTLLLSDYFMISSIWEKILIMCPVCRCGVFVFFVCLIIYSTKKIIRERCLDNEDVRENKTSLIPRIC